MYILYSGVVSLYADPECQQFITNLTPNKVIGETALQNDERRTASITANTKTKLLKLQKHYYKSIVLVSFPHANSKSCRILK